MTVDDAVGLARNCWDALRQLQQQYPSDRQKVALLAAATVNRVIGDIRSELQFARYREVYERLKLEPLCADIDRATGEATIAPLLWEMVDRRTALGIEKPLAKTGQQYRIWQRRSAS